MSKLGKRILWIGLSVVAALVVLLLIAWAMIDRIVKTGIEKGGTYALQVDTTVEDVNLSLLKSHLTLQGLQVANPKDFTTPYLMKSGTFDVGVDRGTLLSDTIRLTEFTLDGLTVYIEQPLGQPSNVSVLMNNVKERFGGGQEKPKEEKKEEGGKKIVVDKVLVRNVTAYIKIGGLKELEVKLPEIPLEGVSSTGEGVNVPQLVAKILPAILGAVVQQAGGLLPPGTLDNMANDLRGAAGALGGNARELFDKSTKGLEEGLKSLGTGLDKSGKDMGEGVKKVGEGLKDLFNKKKD